MFAGRVDRRRMWGHGRERERGLVPPCADGTRVGAHAALLRVIVPNLARLLTRDRPICRTWHDNIWAPASA
eukprot:7375884-Prymnesium_polylepis.3